MNNRIDNKEKHLQDMMDNFRKEIRVNLDYLHTRMEDTNERMRAQENRTEERIRQAQEQNKKTIEEAITPIQTEINEMKENIQKPMPSMENIQLVIDPEIFRPEADQKFYGDGRTNPRVFFKNLKIQIETVDLKKFLRNKFLGDAELWYDIVVDEFETLEQFENIFKQYYWGQQTQAKVREKLYNGRYNETFGTSREIRDEEDCQCKTARAAHDEEGHYTTHC